MATLFADGFSEFWYRYPRRVGKLAARAAYTKALKLTTHEELMAGVERYIKSKPAYADWCHPRTWLSQGRWDDELPPPVKVSGSTCPHVPRCSSTTACIARTVADGRAARSA